MHLCEWNEEDHPRDEDGKFTDGGGGGGSSGSSDAGSSKPSAEEVLSIAKTVAEKYGYDPSKISIGSDSTADFVLNGQPHKAAGMAFIREGPKQGKIELFPNQISRKGAIGGIVIHEIMHQKYQAVMNAYQKEAEKVRLDPGPPPNPNGEHWWERQGGVDGMMKPDGTLRSPYDEKYPIYQAMQQTYYASDHWDKFKEADGASEYSFSWWKAWKGGSASTDQAFHETLAEMARVKYETGKFPDHMGERILSWRGEDKPKPSQAEIAKNAKIWRDFYKAVNSIYDKIK